MNDTKVATKEDIKDLKADSKSVRAEILRVEVKVENLEDGQKRHEMQIRELRIETKVNNEKVNDKLDRLMNTVDGFVGRVDNLTVDNEVGTHQTRELELKVEALEKRVKRIESSKQAS